mgnify:CR=1 FL=1
MVIQPVRDNSGCSPVAWIENGKRAHRDKQGKEWIITNIPYPFRTLFDTKTHPKARNCFWRGNCAGTGGTQLLECGKM